MHQNQEIRPAVASFNEMFAQRNSSAESMVGVEYIQDKVQLWITFKKIYK